jgi:hypothetical protein
MADVLGPGGIMEVAEDVIVHKYALAGAPPRATRLPPARRSALRPTPKRTESSHTPPLFRPQVQ